MSRVNVQADGRPLTNGDLAYATRFAEGAERFAQDPDAPRVEPGPDGHASPETRRAIYRHMRAADHDRIDADVGNDEATWEVLFHTPASGRHRAKLIRKLSGKLISIRVPGPFVLALMQDHNRYWCVDARGERFDPLPSAEVERAVRWVAARHADEHEDAA